MKQLHSKLDLAVYKKNSRARRFHEREGFRIRGERTCEHTGFEEWRMVWSRAAELGSDLEPI